jgi:hypothetical protein
MKMANYLIEELRGIHNIELQIIPNDDSMHEHPVIPHVPRVLVQWDMKELSLSAEQLDSAMASEDPPIFLKERHYYNYFTNKAWRLIDTYLLRPGEEKIVAERLKCIFVGRKGKY